jgi:pimeloyl-ACP methyl ester carboxylesterase
VTLLSTRNPPGVSAKGNLAMFRWDATTYLERMTVPVLVLGGDQDIVTKLDASRTIADQVPGARLRVVEGVNHMGFLERADLYDQVIAEFANTVSHRRERATADV